MKHLILEATIYYNESSDLKEVIHPNAIVNDVEVYRVELKSLIVCNRILINSKEIEQ